MTKDDKIFLPYQIQWFKESQKNRVSFWEKSRRIGASWCDACLSVIKGSQPSPNDTYYIGYNQSMTEQYIQDCAFWAKLLNIAVLSISKKLIKDVDKDILVYRVKLASGKKIVGLSSKPKNLRARQGDVVLDEAAFHESFKELMKAAMALLAWGGSVRVLSSHNGEDSEFNEIVDAIKSQELKYYLQKTTFKQAIKQGLYRQVCKRLKKPYSVENEQEYTKEIYAHYGEGASEELDVVPRSSSLVAVYQKSWFKRIEPSELPECFDYLVRAWDTAATDRDASCFSVGTLLGSYRDFIYILDWKYIKGDASTTEDFYIQVAQADGADIPIVIELEGGSQSILWLENSLKDKLKNFEILGVRPEGSKLFRGLPVARAAKDGKYYIVNADWTDDYLKTLGKFEGKPKSIPLVTDTADSLSLGHSTLSIGINPLLAS